MCLSVIVLLDWKKAVSSVLRCLSKAFSSSPSLKTTCCSSSRWILRAYTAGCFLAMGNAIRCQVASLDPTDLRSSYCVISSVGAATCCPSTSEAHCSASLRAWRFSAAHCSASLRAWRFSAAHCSASLRASNGLRKYHRRERHDPQSRGLLKFNNRYTTVYIYPVFKFFTLHLLS